MINYCVLGFDIKGKFVRKIVHQQKWNDHVRNWLDDFYLRYIFPLDEKTVKRSDRKIVLKEPIQGIKTLIAKNLG